VGSLNVRAGGGGGPGGGGAGAPPTADVELDLFILAALLVGATVDETLLWPDGAAGAAVVVLLLDVEVAAGLEMVGGVAVEVVEMEAMVELRLTAGPSVLLPAPVACGLCDVNLVKDCFTNFKIGLYFGSHVSVSTD